jgi:hypothetical protein
MNNALRVHYYLIKSEQIGEKFREYNKNIARHKQ